jgi:hypothetical protein
MASKDIINSVDINNPSATRRTADLLPNYHRTDKNTKFLASTLDQFIQQPQLERINGYVGSKLSLNYNPAKDQYIDGGSTLRNAYQLEPSLVVQDADQNINLALGYDDLINQLGFFGANTKNLDRLFRPQSYSYDPGIDWDKFVNFGQYYWVPTGPDEIEITGQKKDTISTYTVTDSADGYTLTFTPDGLTPSPLLTLYRGMTYVFNITTKLPFYIKTAYTKGTDDLFAGVANNGTNNGQIILTVDDFTPSHLFYFAEGNDDATGQLVIKSLKENTLLDVENEIIGKKTYKSGNGVVFSNGMKIRFVGDITPTSYLGKQYIVEGVGTAIKLIDFDSLKTLGLSPTNLDVNFDATPFDKYPFDDFEFVPLEPEYVTINRAAPDLNSWSRYNRWVHADVLSATAAANGVPVVFDNSLRAQRPIIEFVAGLQLYNFGTRAKNNVDLIDNITTSAFNTIEGSAGFFIDGIRVEQGFRVIFNADTDPLVRGRIYNVKIVVVNNKSVINLEEAEDSEPLLHDAVVSIRGTEYSVANWWFDGSKWMYGQQKTSLNQAPLFEVYDQDGNAFSDITLYNSDFSGTKIFGYTIGTGIPDPVLGFPLSYKNVGNVGSYLFSNYFMTDKFSSFDTSGNIQLLSVAGNYLKINGNTESSFKDVWTDAVVQEIPILQYQVVEQDTVYVELISIDEPGYAKDLRTELFVNDVKQTLNTDYLVTVDGVRAYVVSTTSFRAADRALVKLYTSNTPSSNGYYEIPANLTNNPLNSSIDSFTFTEVSDHVQTIANSNPNFIGKFPGTSNLRDLGNLSAYGSRLVCHKNPVSFAHYFLGTKEHNIIDSIRKVSTDYNQFKSTLLKNITELSGTYTPSEALDAALIKINSNKDITFPYGFSDMLGYGKDNLTRTYTVTDSRNVVYSLTSVFDSTVLSERAILVYLTNSDGTTQLIKDKDYTISKFEPNIKISVPLVKGNTITVLDYPSTTGSYIPPTPTKLGLYPKFIPSIYFDDTYIGSPRKVIQGHDGSIMVAYNDYRDDIILEFEKRVFNNLKVNYNPDLLDINSVIPGAFRKNSFSRNEITDIVSADFLKWAGFYGVDYQTNSTFDELDSFSFNYSSNIDSLNKNRLPGYWRGVYKYFYDTDRPHTHPWEMLGFSEQPSWWQAVYGPAPYTRGNLILWKDIEEGRIAQGSRAGIDPLYVRTGLSQIIPVDDSGNLLSPTDTGLATTPIVNLADPNRLVVLRSEQISSRWKVGDYAPAETAWRRSSYWPFACQVLMALTKPATYASTLFDTSRIALNKINQYKYGSNDVFLNPSNALLHRDIVNGKRVLAAGHSVFVIEAGLARDITYLSKIKSDLSNLNYNLMVKLGGFASKDKLQITIDSIDPASPYPGVLVPSEDYQIFFNQGAPIESIGISGLIVQKTATGFAIRGYDKFNPYFTILKPFASNSDQIERVGGISESFQTWSANTTYSAGQIVFYSDRYYRVKELHNSGATFTLTYYQSLPYLPTTGGVGVLRRTQFDTAETIVSYGVEYSTIQEVYDFIVGYGRWLISKGFVFDEYNDTLQQVLDWNFTAKEFLYWTTQNWAVNSVITLSPFANKITFQSDKGVVDSLVNNFYEYSLLKADGAPFPIRNFTIVRLDGEFTLSTINTQEGFFFTRLNVVQKEHAIVLQNTTIFNDTVYDIGSGYRQRRVSLKGFRTSNWNGDFFSPGFVFDQAKINDWQKFVNYGIGEVVRFSGKYYTAPTSISGTETFNLDQWIVLGSKPVSQLLPNFDYKIKQFEDFYSLDIDNFDAGQQAMAQHLTGYTPRSYLNNIIGDPIAQYKFYQGYIREKGTKNPLSKLGKSSLNSFQSTLDYNEEWAFRIGHYGGYNTYQELETVLESSKFVENPQIIEFVSQKPAAQSNTVYYKDSTDIIISPEDFDITKPFPITTSTDIENIFELPVAGYPRFDDVTATAYNTNSILDIANNKSLSEGNTIWVGFKSNGDWGVYRVTQVPTIVVGVGINVAGQTLVMATANPHTLEAGDLISVSRIVPGIDQVYTVAQVLSPTQFLVLSTLTTLPSQTPTTISGLLFAFKSSRFSKFDDLTKINYLERWNFGENVWIDDDGQGKWAVYQKTNNYQSLDYHNGFDNLGQHFGTKVATADNTNILLVSSPDYVDATLGYKGRIFVLARDFQGTPQSLNSYSINGTQGTYYSGTDTAFGSSLIFDPIDRLVIASAPITSQVRSVAGNINVSSTLTALSYVEQGLVKLSTLNSSGVESLITVITTPSPENNSKFGASIAYSTTTNKLLVSAPGYKNNTGTVYTYNVSVSTSSITVTSATAGIISAGTTGSNFGFAIGINRSADRIAVSAPGFVSTGSFGAVYIYNTATSLSHIQRITGDDIPEPLSGIEIFGTTIKMTGDGQYLIVGSPTAYDWVRNSQSGVVDIFRWATNKFVHSQRLHAPITSADVSFGYDISVNDSASLLTISSLGNAKTINTTFDTYSERLSQSISTSTYGSIYVNNSDTAIRKKITTFDSKSTGFHSVLKNAGAVHTYNRNNGGVLWVTGQEIFDKNVSSTSSYGQSVFATDNSIYVGAPLQLPNGSNNGQIFIFDKKDTTFDSWKLHRSQDLLVNLPLINRVLTVDTTTEQVQDYIDIVDPIKGRILGTAKQELKFITSYDPAIYSLGITGVNVDSNTNWLDEHVGELWWDLSTVKYVYYEQGDLEYRKNNWNNIFPGSTIDVYEWVRSEYLPADWAQLADTADGLTRGISGQPKFVDNSVISVKQVYNSISNSFSNVYYYWVKNKAILPVNISNRKMAAFQVAQEIADPTRTANKFAAIISPSAVMLSNVKTSVLADQINLNFAFDYINDAANRHTEWLLLQENDPNSKPNWLLEKKLIDSLLGHDSLGNPVPDTALPSKLAYGVEIRPRQSLFANRAAALRNIVEFANSILKTEIITGKVNFDNLTAKDQIPDATTYDSIISDIYSLDLIPTQLLTVAEITPVIDSNGKISKIKIDNPGYGYLTAPTIEILGNGSGAELETVINSQGQLTGVNIINPGSGYDSTLTLTVRPFTVVVQSDVTINGKWAVYTWSKDSAQWIKLRTQDFDTAQYWKYIDWTSTDYDELAPIVTSVPSVYVLEVLKDLPINSYVKVQNGGDGRYLILSRTNGLGGTFDQDWNLVYSQNGTIQILDSLWDSSASLYAWDQTVGFDQTEYDQSPDIEISYIMSALKDDIFVNERKVYWNQLFFKAVRYAMSEQKFLDWAFKTTFISVINNSGKLDQRHTYKLRNSEDYENFLNEIKPYHTKIRRFTELYTSTELTQSFTTDFDLPSYYNTSTLNFNKVEFGNPILQQYPWKSWYDNYTYGIESIDVYDGGAGYTETPTVTIVPAMGDTGYGATAVAFISLGKVNRVIVTNPGFGYATAPTVVFNGGGDTQLTPARAYAQLGLNNVRTNNITIKFDRVSGQREIGQQFHTDTFIGDGEKLTFSLSWVPVAEKSTIDLTVNGVLKLIDTFTIDYSEKTYHTQPNVSYIKKFATLRLNFVPAKSDVIKVTYPKDQTLYTAIDRIEDYYEPTAGMPGKDPKQLMSGLEYAGLSIDTLPFDYAGGWDVLPFGSTPWDNYAPELGYISFATTSTTTQTFTLTNTIVSTGTQVNAYVNGNRVDPISVPTLIGLGTGAVDYLEIQSPGLGYTQSLVTITISAPNIAGGQQARGFVTVDPIDGHISSIGVAHGYQGSGYTETPKVTITGPCSIQAYAKATLKSEFTSTTSTTKLTEVTIPSTDFTSTSSLVVFRYADSDGTVLPTDPDSLDSIINGGDLTYTTALGLSPSEIILDGGSTSIQALTGMNDDGFLNPFNSPAPEECVPGQIREAVGINVYTQPEQSPPVIANRKYNVDGSVLTFKLGIRPTNQDSVIAVFNNKKLPASNYVIDYDANTFTFTSQTPGTGLLSLTSIQSGSIKLLESYYRNIASVGTTVLSTVAFDDIGSGGASVYVTFDGVPGQNGLDYVVGKYKSRARFTFYRTGSTQVYIFGGAVKSFSEVNEQIIISTATTDTFTLNQPPGTLAPFHGQVIVTKNGTRLKPPVTSYYQVTNGQLVFNISNSILYPSRFVDLAKLEVYVNGVLSPAAGIWRLNQADNQITFINNSLADGDVIAIVVKNNQEYLIENNMLQLSSPVQIGDEIHITSFTNHDPDFIRTELFKGHYTNEYALQRASLDSAYVWVSYNGDLLTADVDYSLSTDGRTVIIRPGLFQSVDDVVIITSFAMPMGELTAYKIFKDMLGRTFYKRLSSANSTNLSLSLAITATTISVQDSTVLSQPNISRNRPGVIFIEGERIEFFTINGNELGQLRRGTLGTMPKDVYPAETLVVDQGNIQTMPFQEFVQTTSTIITTSTQVSFDLTGYINFNTTTNYTDQVEVRYGGRLLLKPGLTTSVHDKDAAYDSVATADTILSPEFTITSTSSVLTINFTPTAGVKLEVTTRNSKAFGDSNSPVMKFLAEKPAVLPYSTVEYTSTDITIYLETGEPLTDENNNLIEGF